MATAEQRLAELEAQVAELADTVRKVALQATGVRTFDEMRLARQAAARPAVRPRRPRHLHAVGGAR